MTIYFITGNKHKLAEARLILPDINSVELDLPEIQSLDPQKIIEAKLKEACKNNEGEFFIEDVSLYLECMNGFPGPLVKWMLESIGREGIADLVLHHKNHNASVKAVIGYSNGKDTHFFTGEIKGKIVSPRGKEGFGFDPIFQPQDHNQTFAEMEISEKNQVSHRDIALKKLKDFLQTHNKENHQ
ncbi:RdgB/HAM1 family non-canonical purine NTP pyrophosphatase [Candidatus Woesearchaeota archaeon]|jgi:inosine triphosphate pyrophosphatase|nr:RdgB/HAM1 family non-canonical purine NTP pyrophosphatase [Candidatus Woesearchaeota archaeon]MBT4151046.1 RdgB/HAM1 family non-canonical purine NTP pyrophosphatase [Candidatus Woesearchaeota archaeon]MBT4247577.1 RdgB/HAM1 family non-canonical purine NTP pyrophosphatase [Candidatus Woesearchaeota archaeon]MBT4433836.1 RdgB/HAM1 family non-canonical purine NTP pyrophosphatase [Candidatus Woesearchaeota archaeon]MBT7332165.1 RdgB/HAM1 family non-canonical purine NTP pyrophosphatase [Candidatu